MFVDRRAELKVLHSAYGSLKSGEKVNVAIIGPRRIGKTELLLKFREKAKGVVPYLNLQRIGSLDSFIFAYTRELLYEIANTLGLEIGRSELLTWDDLLILSAKLEVDREVRAIKDGCLETLFEIQESILEKTGQKAVFILDEFQEVLNFKGFLEVMRAVTEKQKNIAYFISGSAVRMMEEILAPKNPFFGQFRRIYLKGLPREDAIELAKTTLERAGIEASRSALELIYKLTQGHPFYVLAVCRRLIEEGFEKIRRKDVHYAFLTELLTEKGDIYMHLEYVFNESLSRAYKGPIHKQILLILAQEEGLRLSEIARRLGKPSGEVSNYLKFLLRTDLIVRQNEKYYFADKLMRFWLAKTYLGITELELRREKYLEELIKELEEKYLRVKRELGLARESVVREKMREVFGIDFKPYRRGDVEFDGVAFSDKIYVLEVKWRNKPATYRDVEEFVKKAKEEFGSAVMFFFSKSGFTEKAKELCKKEGVKMLIPVDLECSAF
ncbi:ATPase [Thermococcus litoralis DSM 5473]|jgi:AAA+ ATPase superfamily predicted ATPase|uniref:ATPase n=1 Tax=Thermococcus litoralis (strain ATCC 51850 / DSM 5473 / JCM 8560 / NS-C) TaxID=523849 RepID=H3ZLQ0_THELN|nr:ATP-binding protein [Thermococcus litoralis]EHR79112.1 ATPase [Thermococcus litoralis DSM 5473]